MENNDILQSKVIDFLRFPMIIGVVLLHAHLGSIKGLNIPDTGIPIYQNLSFFISKIIVYTAVPLFFFISGYLFFYHVTSFSFDIYKKKLKTRIYTLLVPYLFWNAIILIGHLLVESLSPIELTSGAYKLVRDYTFRDYLSCFWRINGTFPINGVLWFVRDLMIMVVCSPVVYFCLRYLRWLTILILGSIWMAGFSLDIPSTIAIFFFTLGAWFSVNGRNFVTDFKPFFPWGGLLYLFFAIGIIGARGTTGFIYVSNAGILLGIVSGIALTAHYIEKGKWKVSKFLIGSCFFIYASHQLPINISNRILFRFIHPTHDWQYISIYLVVPLIIILLGLLFYALIEKCIPRFTAIITGGRS